MAYNDDDNNGVLNKKAKLNKGKTQDPSSVPVSSAKTTYRDIVNSSGSSNNDTSPIIPSSKKSGNNSSLPIIPTEMDWQDRLKLYPQNQDAAYSEIDRAKSVWQSKMDAGDIAGAEAAHTWANQIRDALGLTAGKDYDYTSGASLIPTTDTRTVEEPVTRPLIPEVPTYNPQQPMQYQPWKANTGLQLSSGGDRIIPTLQGLNQWYGQQDKLYERNHNNDLMQIKREELESSKARNQAEIQKILNGPSGSNYSPSQKVDDLMKVWSITGKAPAGLESLGVAPGTIYPGSKGAGQGDEAKYQEAMPKYISAINSGQTTLKQAYDEIDQYIASRIISQSLGEVMKATLKNMYEQKKTQGNGAAYDFDYSAGFAP